MGLFAYSVETLDAARHSPHLLGEFRHLHVAIRAARHALDDRRVNLAIVKDSEGVLRFVVDRHREWPARREEVVPIDR